MSDTTLDQQIRAAQVDAQSPMATLRMRDALLLAIVGGMSRDGKVWPDNRLWASEATLRVEALMAWREKQIAQTVEDIETYGKARARTEGVLLMTSGELLATALLARFGGAVEIPQAELKASADAFRGYVADTDDERGVVRFSPLPRLKSEDEE